MKCIVSSCSARPNFVKLAAVHHAMMDYGGKCEHVIVHTGQHYDPLFSDVFFQQLAIPLPAHNLDIHGGTREEVIERTQAAFEKVLEQLKPDVLLAYGDVNGAVGAARAAKKLGVKLGHVEAGLRSFDQSMPEEHNRIEIDERADYLFVTEQSGMDNLKKEGKKGARFLVGNTMIDTLVRMMPLIEAEPLSPDLNFQFAVATLHRPSNVDTKEALAENLKFLKEVSKRFPVVLPLHHRTRTALENFGLKNEVPKDVTIIDPLGYVPFLKLVSKSQFILTDSGGIQEEATFLKKRCFTLRKNTERPSTIESGSNILIDIEKEADRKKVLDFAEHPVPPAVKVPQMWDGKAGGRIVGLLVKE